MKKFLLLAVLVISSQLVHAKSQSNGDLISFVNGAVPAIRATPIVVEVIFSSAITLLPGLPVQVKNITKNTTYNTSLVVVSATALVATINNFYADAGDLVQAKLSLVGGVVDIGLSAPQAVTTTDISDEFLLIEILPL
ncbi:hypothetical protein LX64_00747 [Chitinophaga skermanii]|uniref:Uncharacterized protein n=1 Tax=Chitinophaga skermanii TaxID=331697 RepID=A0A327R2S6_9BACT|nr:hypothetical protein [Chitinophaga skermanii]RAJ11139.1 hypothetical protein LX64_00747 [Chitinophaga skermanii]